MSHYYNGKGELITKVQSSKQNRLVNVTIKHARVLGLYPSVTTITGILDRPDLNRWFKTRLIEVCADHPRSINEKKEWYASRINKIFEEESSDAPEFGTFIHNNIEHMFSDKPIHKDAEMYVNLIKEYLELNKLTVINSEFSLVPEITGYGGTIDLLVRDEQGEYFLIDFKTTESFYDKDGEKRIKQIPYESYQLQCAAYKKAIDTMLSINCKTRVIYISKEECELQEYNITEEENKTYTKMFGHLYLIWKLQKNHDPERPEI